MPPSLTKLGLWFRVVVTAAVLTLVLRTVDWAALSELPARLDWPVLVLAALFMGSAYPLHAVRLGLLLRQQGIHLPFGELHRITWISIFFGSFTPGGVGGDISRLLHVYTRMPENKPGATIAVLADRVLGLASLLFLAIVAASMHSFSVVKPSSEVSALIPLFVGCNALLMAGWWLATNEGSGKLANRIFQGTPFAVFHGRAFQTFRPTSILFSATIVAVAIWLADFAAGWLLARALGWPVGLVEISVALAVAYTVASLPLSIGGHGVREGALVVVLGWFGLSSGAPLLAVAFLALTLLWSLVGGIVYLAWPASPPEKELIESRSID